MQNKQLAYKKNNKFQKDRMMRQHHPILKSNLQFNP